MLIKLMMKKVKIKKSNKMIVMMIKMKLKM